MLFKKIKKLVAAIESTIVPIVAPAVSQDEEFYTCEDCYWHGYESELVNGKGCPGCGKFDPVPVWVVKEITEYINDIAI